MSLPDLVTYKGRFVENMTKAELITALNEVIVERNELRQARDEARGDVYKLVNDVDQADVYKKAYEGCFHPVESEPVKAGDTFNGAPMKVRELFNSQREHLRKEVVESKYGNNPFLPPKEPPTRAPMSIKQAAQASEYQKIVSGPLVPDTKEEGPQPPKEDTPSYMLAGDWGLSKPNPLMTNWISARKNEINARLYTHEEIEAIAQERTAQNQDVVQQITGLAGLVGSPAMCSSMRMHGRIDNEPNTPETQTDNKIVAAFRRAYALQGRIANELDLPRSCFPITEVVKAIQFEEC